MATNTLNIKTGAHVVINEDFNEIITALAGDFVGRSATTRAASDQERLGTPAIPWAELHATNVFVGGALLDLENLGAGTNTKNAINQGFTRTGSGQPDFLRADGASNTATLRADDSNNLAYTANNVGVILTADVTLTSLQTAPTTNNTATVNESTLSGGSGTRYAGEGQGGSIDLDNVGQEIIDRVGQYVCFKHGTNELMFAFIQTVNDTAFTATITNVYRGFFFDDSGDPIVRETMSDNDTLTLMSLGWVYGQNNGTVFDVSYTSPVYSATEPANPVTDDYWFNLTEQNWFRYDGSAFVQIERLLLGLVVCDDTNCIASRSADFAKSFSDIIDMEMDTTPRSEEIVETAETYSKVSVYGRIFEYFSGRHKWDILTDLETGLTEQNDFLYYLYLTDEGESIISDERPYDRTADLQGYYHPYHAWRYIGVAYNDSGGDFSSANSKNNNQRQVEVFTSSSEFLAPVNVDNVRVELQGGGGGGGGLSGSRNGSGGGTSSFGAIFSATGGGGGNGTNNPNIASAGGSGGSGINGDLNIGGGDGSVSSTNAHGGDSFFGSGGQPRTSVTNGNVGTGYGTGGKGQGPGYGGGGGGGGYALKYINNVDSRVPITIGGGGSGRSSSGGNSGRSGICIVEY